MLTQYCAYALHAGYVRLHASKRAQKQMLPFMTDISSALENKANNRV
jgi:hypothetical protein